MGSGRKPLPSPRSCASSLACIVGTVNTSWPPRRLTVTPLPRCTESATAIARCARRSSSPSTPSPVASGWWGATANTNPTLPMDWLCRPGMAPELGPTPSARSAWPDVSASSVPDRVSSRNRKRVGGSSWKKAQASSISTGRAIRPSAARVSCGSQPVATRLTRLATASISSNRRPPSRNSSAPASVMRAWREVRSNSSTSRASSIWRTR